MGSWVSSLWKLAGLARPSVWVPCASAGCFGHSWGSWLWAPWAECPSDQSLGVDLNVAWLAPGLVSIKAPRGLGRPGRVWGQCHGCGKSHRHARGSRRTPLPSRWWLCCPSCPHAPPLCPNVAEGLCQAFQLPPQWPPLTPTW